MTENNKVYVVFTNDEDNEICDIFKCIESAEKHFIEYLNNEVGYDIEDCKDAFYNEYYIKEFEIQ